MQDSCLLCLVVVLLPVSSASKGKREEERRHTKFVSKAPTTSPSSPSPSSATPYRPRKLSNPQQLSTTATPNSTWSYCKLRGDEPFDGCGQATTKLSVLACYLLDFCGKERVDNFTSFPRKIRESSKGKKRDRRKRVQNRGPYPTNLPLLIFISLTLV